MERTRGSLINLNYRTENKKKRRFRVIAWFVLIWYSFSVLTRPVLYAAIYTGGSGSGSGYGQGVPTATVYTLSFTTSLTSTAAGQVFATQPVVSILDRNSTVVDPATECTITISISNNPSGGTLGGTAAMTSVAGVANFSGKGLYIDKAGNLYTLSAAASAGTCGSSVASATSSSFNIQVGEYTVRSELSYDASANAYRIRSWLEQGGAIVSSTSWGSSDITLTIYDETGTALAGGNAPAYSSIINNNIFVHTWTVPSGGEGDVFTGTVSIKYPAGSSTSYSAGTTLNTATSGGIDTVSTDTALIKGYTDTLETSVATLQTDVTSIKTATGVGQAQTVYEKVGDILTSVNKANWDDLKVMSEANINWDDTQTMSSKKINWDDIKTLSDANISWSELSSFTVAGINWSDFVAMTTGGVNWTDIGALSVQNINWADLQALGDANVNWSDFQVLADANINWLDFQTLADANINWSDFQILADKNINWDDIKVLADANINWADLQVLLDQNVNWTDIQFMLDANVNWDDMAYMAGAGVNWDETINWDNLKQLTTARVNWQDLQVFSDANINWGDLQVLSESNVNWNDFQVLSDANVNWTDLAVMGDANVNWQDLAFMGGAGMNWTDVSGQTTSHINWSEIAGMTAVKINWSGIKTLSDAIDGTGGILDDISAIKESVGSLDTESINELTDALEGINADTITTMSRKIDELKVLFGVSTDLATSTSIFGRVAKVQSQMDGLEKKLGTGNETVLSGLAALKASTSNIDGVAANIKTEVDNLRTQLLGNNKSNTESVAQGIANLKELMADLRSKSDAIARDSSMTQKMISEVINSLVRATNESAKSFGFVGKDIQELHEVQTQNRAIVEGKLDEVKSYLLAIKNATDPSSHLQEEGAPAQAVVTAWME